MRRGIACRFQDSASASVTLAPGPRPGGCALIGAHGPEDEGVVFLPGRRSAGQLAARSSISTGGAAVGIDQHKGVKV